jgi:hypothetical protein
MRINPYLRREARKHLWMNVTSNSSDLYRTAPTEGDLLMGDFSQEFQRLTKVKSKSELKFDMGPHMPIDKWIEMEIRLKMSKDSKTIYRAARMHDDEVRLYPYNHMTKGFDDEDE